MKLNKQQKQFVIQWVERQFSSDNLFPCQSKNDMKACKSNLAAYKAWTKTPQKKPYISAWIDEWLSDKERQRLEKAMKKYEASLEDN